MKSVFVCALILALAQHAFGGVCNTDVIYNSTLITPCLGNDVAVLWPDYSDFTKFYKCVDFGKPVLMDCPQNTFFTYYYQQCTYCKDFLDAPSCETLATTTDVTCVPNATTKPTPAPTTKPTQAPTSKPTAAPTSKPTAAPTPTETTVKPTKPTKPPTVTVPTVPTVPGPPIGTDAPSSGVPTPPVVVTANPDVPTPPGQGVTPPVMGTPPTLTPKPTVV